MRRFRFVVTYIWHNWTPEDNTSLAVSDVFGVTGSTNLEDSARSIAISQMAMLPSVQLLQDAHGWPDEIHATTIEDDREDERA